MHDIVKTGSKDGVAGELTRIFFSGPFPDDEYSIDVWIYTQDDNRVEILPVKQTRYYFEVVPMESATIYYQAIKQIT